MQRQHASNNVAMSTSTSESTNQLSGVSNMAVQEDLGTLAVDGGTVTPGVAFGNTSASRFGNLAKDYGGEPGVVYEVTFNLARLMQLGATANDIGDLKKVNTLEGLGYDKDTDYIEVNGTEVVGVGAVPFIIRGGYNLGYDDEVSIRVGNNGLLCLDRLARSAMELGQGFGATEDTGYTLDTGKNLEVLCALRMGNEVKNVDARSDGFLAGVDPSDLRSRVQSMIYATMGASTADRVGLGGVDKPGIGIAPTAMWANRYREYDREQGGTFSDQAAGRLNTDIGRLFMDQPGRPPETYINTMVDFKAEIAELFANNGSDRARMKSHSDFLLAVRDKLKAALDLSFLDNTDPGFQERFRQHWMKSIDEAFARTQNLTLLGKDEQWIHSDHVYDVRPQDQQQVVAMVHDNSEGLQDGNAYFQMPNFSDWGMNPAVEEKVEEAPATGTSDAVGGDKKNEPKPVSFDDMEKFLVAEQNRLGNFDAGEHFHLMGTSRHNSAPAPIKAVLQDIVDNGGDRITNITELTYESKGAYAALVEAWLAWVRAQKSGGDASAEKAAFDAALAAFKG